MHQETWTGGKEYIVSALFKFLDIDDNGLLTAEELVKVSHPQAMQKLIEVKMWGTEFLSVYTGWSKNSTILLSEITMHQIDCNIFFAIKNGNFDCFYFKQKQAHLFTIHQE